LTSQKSPFQTQSNEFGRHFCNQLRQLKRHFVAKNGKFGGKELPTGNILHKNVNYLTSRGSARQPALNLSDKRLPLRQNATSQHRQAPVIVMLTPIRSEQL
jgi:hypothetical protein